MAHEAVQTLVSGIKCDACPWQDDTVGLGDYEAYLDKPCPDCGANLLTEADFAAAKAILAGTAWLNALIGPWVDADACEPVEFCIGFDGSGVPIITPKPEDA